MVLLVHPTFPADNLRELVALLRKSPGRYHYAHIGRGSIQHLTMEMFLATIGAATPSFVLAIFMILLFSVKLGWLPTGGWGGPKEAVMPVLALAALPIAYIARVMRSSMLEVLSSDYIRTARAKGASENRVIIQHALRNSMIPTVTVVGLALADIMSGAVLTETIFAWPGIGRYAFQSTVSLDFPAIIGVTLLIAAGLFLTGLVSWGNQSAWGR